MKRRTMISGLTAAALAFSLPIAVAGPAQAGPMAAAAGSYQTVSPVRVLDTRYGIGAPQATIAPLSTVTFTIPDKISTSIGAVLLEVTVVNPTAAGFITAFGAGTTRPVVSNINFQQGQNVPNTVIVRPSAGNSVSIFNGSRGTINLLADVQGYFQAGANQGDPATLVPVTPARYLDTRIGVGAAKGKVAPLSTTTVQIAGGGAIPSGASAAVVNLTAVSSSGQGFLTAYAGPDRSGVSTVNFYAGQNRANLALVPLNDDGTISVFNGSPYSVDLLADVSGYFTAIPATATTAVDGAFLGLSGRAIDTRSLGTGSGYVPSLATLNVPLFPETSGMGSIVRAVSVNVTAVGPQAAGFLTTWDGSTTVPAVSNVNFQVKRDSAGSIVVPLNPDGSISIYNGSFGNVDMIVDVTGVFVQGVMDPTRLQALARAALSSPRQPTVVRHR